MLRALGATGTRLALGPALARTTVAAPRCGALPLLLRHHRASLSTSPPSASAAVANPLLGISSTAPSTSAAAAAPPPEREGNIQCVFDWHQLPVSHNKLRLIAKQVRGLYWREAMLQLEFHQKMISVHIKNAINKAVDEAERQHGLNTALLIVKAVRVGKGTYTFSADYKARGRAGKKSNYQANVSVILEQLTPAQIQLTRYYERWRNTQKMLDTPWEERVKDLPRYKPFPGYAPGVKRVQPVYADPLTVDPRSSRELAQTYTPPSRWTHGAGQAGPETGINSGRGYNSRMNPWKAVGTPREAVRPRKNNHVSGMENGKRKIRRAG